MEIDKRYLFPIIIALIGNWVASLCTYYALNIRTGEFTEANPIATILFNTIGHFATFLLFSLLIIMVMFIIIRIIEKENSGFRIPAFCALSGFATLLSLDAINDILMILNHPLKAYPNALLNFLTDWAYSDLTVFIHACYALAALLTLLSGLRTLQNRKKVQERISS